MRKESEDLPVFIAQAGPLNGQRWPLRGPIIIGRDPSCTISIPDRQVSRQHARLTPSPRGVLIEDLQSKNGTHCNGHRLTEPHVLQDGDNVQIALAQQFTFLSSDATLPLEDDEFAMPTFHKHRLRIEKRSHRIWINNHEVIPPLSASQYKLLEVLYDHPGQVVSRADVIETVWGEEQAVVVSEQALDALVRRVRDRLAGMDPNHVYITTIRGHGLRLDNPNEED